MTTKRFNKQYDYQKRLDKAYIQGKWDGYDTYMYTEGMTQHTVKQRHYKNPEMQEMYDKGFAEGQTEAAMDI